MESGDLMQGRTRNREWRTLLDFPARDGISIPDKSGLFRMKQFFLKLFTWWNGQTFGTQLWTWRFGELVGEDAQGNRYYRTRGGAIDPTCISSGAG